MPGLRRHARTCSKMRSKEMPPERPGIDHRIELEEGRSIKELGFSPLYKQSSQQLEEVKRYVVENLANGFIEDSNAPFSSPTLFIAKPDGFYDFAWIIRS